MMDNRTALKNGYEIDAKDGKKIWIHSEVGRGASCIVYDAEYRDSIGVMHNTRIKECYPSYLLIERGNNGELMPFDANEDKFKAEKDYFIQAYQRNVAIKNTLGLTNSTTDSADIIRHNNTCYIVMSLNEGSDYKKYEDQSLKELLMHLRSLAELIKKYHDNGYLHLDIKPENIFILPETVEHILLFDFDSVIRKDELTEQGRFRLSFSKGFSSPEQIQGKVNKIDNHTDIFSIGALLFYKLFGRKAALEECMISYTYQFDQMRYYREEYQPKLYRTLENFFKKTLSASIIPRWNNMQQVIDCLNELIPLSDVDGVYLIDSFQYNAACFIGRESELDEMHYILEKNQLVFLSGIGGIGKTELAKQYADRHRNRYDTIIFSVFDKDIESLVNDEIMINHIERDESESESGYFERKIEILKHIVTDKDLIIIDNFDVDSDDKLETLFSCPCKFIITSRMDFRDYNYEQIDVDRMESLEDVLNLFYTYNDKVYNTEDTAAVEKLVEYVDFHTMTVELISKYLRVSGEAPSELLNRFMEKEGIANTDDIGVKQRKDRQLRSETVNHHLEILFDVSRFDETEKEIMGSLSLYAGIRIRKNKFEEISSMDNISEKLDKLIKRGWIEYNEKNNKISLHQVIQDLIYKNLRPCAENCPNIVEGMSKYIAVDTASYSEKRIKNKVFDVFMSRMTGKNVPYVRLCMLYGKEDKLDEAEQICLEQEDKEAYDVLQRVYRKKIGIINDLPMAAYTSDFELDNYRANSSKHIEELLGKITDYCWRYSDDPNYIIKEYIETGRELYEAIDDNIGWYSDERIPDLDTIYYKIIDMFDTVTELLPKSSYTVREKKRFYKRIMDFYSNDNFCYRSFFFLDLEKAYWYQECINELTRNEMQIKSADAKGNLYTHEISFNTIAEKCEQRGEYEKAIEYYKKSYENGDERYQSVMQSIAHIYLKMDNSERAIECLEKALDLDKANASYTFSICIELIESLIKFQKFEKAKAYALELIHYGEPDILKDGNHSIVLYVLLAYYYLYNMENDPKKKELLWQQCIKYYKMLGNSSIDDEIYNFIVEYLMKEDVCFDEVLEIIDRIGNYHTKDIKEKIILNAIDKNINAVGFGKYHVILMIKYAQVFIEYSREVSNGYLHELIKEAENRCGEAQELYLKYGLNDEYIQSLLYNTMAEIISHDSDYKHKQVLELRKKCNYIILAEQWVKKVDKAGKKIDIWTDAAIFYACVENYKMQIYSLEKALKILVPILNRYAFNDFEYLMDASWRYWPIMEDIIRAYVELKDFKKAKYKIDECYKKTMELYSVPENCYSAEDRISKIQTIADFYIKCSMKEKAINTYLIAMYMGLEKDKNKLEMLKGDVLDINICQLSEIINLLLNGTIDNDIIDSLINIKDELVRYRDDYHGDISIYDEIISKINDRHQNRDIEFKKLNTF